ncbi:glutathione S-transferase U9-like isoform X2 [Humulus lupulus]|uniref:glutathione S-transferase U9-like isoform X2 n=1 Tax=Humulus lupulus TaxID=3486 RepID=UPI002B403AE7|nr:glutathione S-transferase U9-like isoform X2 [Humulus lupulus]
MAEEHRVTLHGMWASSFCKRVEVALKIKGIPYKHVEEDLMNKSPLLLQYNPVYKKVPVLVHHGRPLSESLVILEYIEETWRNGPMLLPEDPFKRAQVRFWVNFFQQVLFENNIFYATITDGEEQEKNIKELHEKLRLLEDGMNDYYVSNGKTPNERGNLGVLDILVWSTFAPHIVYEEVIGTKIVDPEKYPLIFSWIAALDKVPVLKELGYPHEKLLALLLSVRNTMLKTS